MQIKEYKRSINIPEIFKTPGSFHGAQYKFRDLLLEKAEEEVAS